MQLQEVSAGHFSQPYEADIERVSMARMGNGPTELDFGPFSRRFMEISKRVTRRQHVELTSIIYRVNSTVSADYHQRTEYYDPVTQGRYTEYNLGLYELYESYGSLDTT